MKKTILILAANPKDTPQLRLDQEVREIENGLERAQKREEFTVKQKWASRPVDVRRAMLDFNPNIVHFCGHGAGEEGIAFEDEMGEAKFVKADALAGFFKLFADKVECVVLNACYSEVQAKAITKHIPYVIGMSKAISDISAIEFSVAFYDALGAGKTFEFAHRLACNAIQWENAESNLMPILITQRQSGLNYSSENEQRIKKESENELNPNINPEREDYSKLNNKTTKIPSSIRRSANLIYLSQVCGLVISFLVSSGGIFGLITWIIGMIVIFPFVLIGYKIHSGKKWPQGAFSVMVIWSFLEMALVLISQPVSLLLTFILSLLQLILQLSAFSLLVRQESRSWYENLAVKRD